MLILAPNPPGGITRSAILRYGVAVFSVALALLLTSLLGQTMNRATYPFFFAAVTVSAWYGGLGPGLLATALAALASEHFLISPGPSLVVGLDSLVRLGAFVLVALLISSLSAGRARALKASRESEERLFTTLRSIGDAVIATDADAHVTFMNSVAQSLTGWGEEEARGKGLGEVFRIINEETRETAENPVAKAIREGKIIGLANHTVLITKGGAEIPIADSAAPIRGDDGSITGVVLVFRDVTERKRAEGAQLRQARQAALRADVSGAFTEIGASLQAVLQHCAEAVARHLDAALARIWTFNEAESVLELQASAGMYTDIHDAFSRIPLGQLKIGQIAERRAPYLTNDIFSDPWVANKEGLRREGVVSFAGYPLLVENRLVGVVAMFARGQLTPDTLDAMGVVADILAQGVERKRAEDRLRESEERYRSLVSVLTSIVWTVDPEGRFATPQAQWEAYTGQGWEQHRDFGWGEAIHPEDRAGVLASWEKAVAARGVYRSEGRLWHAPSGEYRWFRASAVPLLNPDGSVREWVGTVTDVHDQREAAEERERLLREAGEANRLKDEFLATVSHELRTPLTPIIGWTHLLRTGWHDEATRARALDAIERSARAQELIVNDLLDVSRIIKGKLRLNVTSFDLAPVIRTAVDAIYPAAEAKAIQVQTALAAEGCRVTGDPDRLQQVMWNLLSNAVKFTPKGGRVEVRLGRVGSHVEIAVSDTGVGIGREFLPYVFDRFRQADSSATRAYGGLGLGLSIVRQLVELHGGTVHVESAGEGRGTTFTLKLPLEAVRREEGKPELAAPTARLSAHYEETLSLEGLSVVVVDDEADTLEMLAMILKQYGAEVTKAASAGEALEAVERTSPDALVADIGMPGGDGYELIRKVRKLKEGAGGATPAVALTAYARAEDRTRALLEGYQVHVAKPVVPTELVAVVASLAGRVKR